MRFVLYLIRWQLSTPILAVAMVAFVELGTWLATILANLIGACIFFFVDKLIFERGFETRTSSSVKNSSFNKNLYVDKHQKKQ